MKLGQTTFWYDTKLGRRAGTGKNRLHFVSTDKYLMTFLVIRLKNSSHKGCVMTCVAISSIYSKFQNIQDIINLILLKH